LYFYAVICIVCSSASVLRIGRTMRGMVHREKARRKAMILSIEIDTTGVNGALADERDQLLAEANSPPDVLPPRLVRCVQDPTRRYTATSTVVGSLASPQPISKVETIGLCGRMQGVTLLDEPPLAPGASGLAPALMLRCIRSRVRFRYCHDTLAGTRVAEGARQDFVLRTRTRARLASLLPSSLQNCAFQ
jgi:hypothetical protein